MYFGRGRFDHVQFLVNITKTARPNPLQDLGKFAGGIPVDLAAQKVAACRNISDICGTVPQFQKKNGSVAWYAEIHAPALRPTATLHRKKEV